MPETVRGFGEEDFLKKLHSVLFCRIKNVLFKLLFVFDFFPERWRSTLFDIKKKKKNSIYESTNSTDEQMGMSAMKNTQVLPESSRFISHTHTHTHTLILTHTHTHSVSKLLMSANCLGLRPPAAVSYTHLTLPTRRTV